MALDDGVVVVTVAHKVGVEKRVRHGFKDKKVGGMRGCPTCCVHSCYNHFKKIFYF